MSEKELDINAIGYWTVLIILVLGAIVSGIMGKMDVAGTCAAIAFLLWVF